MRRELKGWLADILVRWAFRLDPQRFVQRERRENRRWTNVRLNYPQ